MCILELIIHPEFETQGLIVNIYPKNKTDYSYFILLRSTKIRKRKCSIQMLL